MSNVIRYRFALSPTCSWLGKAAISAETSAEEPILTRHFGYDIQILASRGFLGKLLPEAGNGAFQA